MMLLRQNPWRSPMRLFTSPGLGRSILPALRPHSALLGIPLLAFLFIGGCPSSKPAHVDIAKNGLIQPPLWMPRDVDATPPDIAIEPPVWPISLALNAAMRPPNPPSLHRPSNPSEPEETQPAKPPETPQISPQLTQEQFARAKASFEADVRVAQQNLDATSGKNLTPDQKDMADKIRSFMKQAQDAAAASDWGRASSLAEKARLLSVDLLKLVRS